MIDPSRPLDDQVPDGKRLEREARKWFLLTTRFPIEECGRFVLSRQLARLKESGE